MTKQLCIELPDLAFPVKLEQTGLNSFTVTYGLQVRKYLCYTQACTELGACIMHALACDGKLSSQGAD